MVKIGISCVKLGSVCVNLFISMIHNYWDLISIENLFQAWNEFKKGKRKRKDVMIFERSLEDNLFNLHYKLKNKLYKHGNYQSFYVHDPKLRHIHKAKVGDRIVHHLLYNYLYNLYDKSFIFDSYSCRINKGTHKAVNRLGKFTLKVSKNYTRDCWALKLDIKKFFASVDHQVLMELLRNKLEDKDILCLMEEVISSFCTCYSLSRLPRPLTSLRARNDNGHTGIPLGNLTSQIFANIYMNELDQFIKHNLKIQYYLRYADDFIILYCSNDLNQWIKPIEGFLNDRLKLELHPKKIILRKLGWGIDFLGYIVLPHYILPRTKTKRRIFNKLKQKMNSPNFNQSLQSYLGYLSHANSFKIASQLKNKVWIWN